MIHIITSPKSLRSLVAEINKGKYNFDLPIQRRADIWKPKEKSLFIDTLLKNYPLYPALVNKHSDTKKLMLLILSRDLLPLLLLQMMNLNCQKI